MTSSPLSQQPYPGSLALPTVPASYPMSQPLFSSSQNSSMSQYSNPPVMFPSPNKVDYFFIAVEEDDLVANKHPGKAKLLRLLGAGKQEANASVYRISRRNRWNGRTTSNNQTNNKQLRQNQTKPNKQTKQTGQTKQLNSQIQYCYNREVKVKRY